jgi:hypothetical protein
MNLVYIRNYEYEYVPRRNYLLIPCSCSYTVHTLLGTLLYISYSIYNYIYRVYLVVPTILRVLVGSHNIKLSQQRFTSGTLQYEVRLSTRRTFGYKTVPVRSIYSSIYILIYNYIYIYIIYIYILIPYAYHTTPKYRILCTKSSFFRDCCK